MSVHITCNGNRIHATGKDANNLLIAVASDEVLQVWLAEGHGTVDFRRMIQEALKARESSVHTEGRTA